MRAKKKNLPGWFPFAVASSLVLVLFAGAKSGWTLSKDKPPPQPPQWP